MKTKETYIQRIIAKAVWLCLLTYICAGAGVNARAAGSAWDDFVPPHDDKFDWIQLQSGEWLKGELKVLYDYRVEFDSDELGLMTFDLEDIKQIRTHKPQSIRVEDAGLSEDPVIVEGILSLSDDKVIVKVGDEHREFERRQLISIAQADKKEIHLWSGSISLGANIREGNTETADSNIKANAKRRTALTRLVIDYVGNFSETDGVETSNNHRLSGYRDLFISKRFFWRQLGAEYYRDRYKNIDDQVSLVTLLGYDIIHTPKTSLEISAGPGARYTKFSSTEPGESDDNTSPVFVVGAMYDEVLSSWVDLLVNYDFQIVEEDAGTYTHHFITTLSTDLIGDIDLDTSFVWDRIEDPQPDSDGESPEQDDYQITIAFSYDF